MKVFQIKEKDGTDWGLWAASDSNEALGMLAAEAAADPEAFPGFDGAAQLIASRRSASLLIKPGRAFIITEE